MADEAQRDGDSGSRQGAAQDLILELNFVPNWARKPPSVNRYAERDDSRYDRRDRRPDRRRGQRDTRGRDRFDDRRGGGRRERRPGPRTPERDMPPPERPRERAPAAFRPRPEFAAADQPPVEVKFVPEQQRLSAVVRRIHRSRRAHPVMEVASLFVAKPDSCEVKIELLPEANGQRMFQCKVCRMVSLDRESMLGHVVDAHIEDYFAKEEVVGDAPSGNFTCVARCGLSGTLLAPPNHHSYAERVREVHHARYPNMPLEYQHRIQMCHEAEAIEAWKEESRKQTLFRLKSGDSEQAPMKWAEAEAHFRRYLAEDMVVETRRAVLPERVAMNIPHRGLKSEVRRAWDREMRFPLTLSFALRAAFHHRSLHVFKAGSGKGIMFVTSTCPAPLNTEHVVDSIREVLEHLREHPGCTRVQLVEGLRPGAEPDSEDAGKVLEPLSWLIEKGHIIEFFDGTLSVPLRSGRRMDRRDRPRRPRARRRSRPSDGDRARGGRRDGSQAGTGSEGS